MGESVKSFSYKLNDLVWAKMPSYCSWPGRVSAPTQQLLKQRKNPLHQCIFFFGSNNYAWIDEKNLKPYAEFKAQMMPLGKPKESFLAAIDDIESFIENPAVFDALFEPQATTPARKKVTPKAKKSDIDLDFDSLRDSDNSVTSPVSIKKTIPARKSSATANIRRSLTRPAVPAIAEKTPKSILTVKRKATIENESHEADSSVRSPAEKKARPIINPEPSDSVEDQESEDLYNLEFDLESNSAKSKIVPSQLTFGFLGLGVMGSRIVKRLLEYGHAVIIWNRTSEKCHGFQHLGAIQVFSPAEVLEQAHITFSCVSDPAASKEMVFGNSGILAAENITTDKGYVEMTSIDAETSRDLSDALIGKGVRYLEAQLQGSDTQAESGQLVILGAGDRSLFDDCQSCFKAISKQSYYLGDVESATKMNSVMQTIAGITMAALAETMALAELAGIQQKDVMEVLELTNLKSEMIMEKGRAIVNKQFTPASMALTHLQKDLKLAINFADTIEQPLPLAAASNEMFKEAKRLGLGARDISAVYIKADYTSFRNGDL